MLFVPVSLLHALTVHEWPAYCVVSLVFYWELWECLQLCEMNNNPMAVFHSSIAFVGVGTICHVLLCR